MVRTLTNHKQERIRQIESKCGQLPGNSQCRTSQLRRNNFASEVPNSRPVATHTQLDYNGDQEGHEGRLENCAQEVGHGGGDQNCLECHIDIVAGVGIV